MQINYFNSFKVIFALKLAGLHSSKNGKPTRRVHVDDGKIFYKDIWHIKLGRLYKICGNEQEVVCN